MSLKFLFVVAFGVIWLGCSDDEVGGECVEDTDCSSGHSCLDGICTSETEPNGSDVGELDASPTNCDEFLSSEETGETVTFSVQHDGTQPLYFSPGYVAIPIDLSKEGEESLAWFGSPNCVPRTCEGFLAHSDCHLSCTMELPTFLALLEPGDEYTRSWQGDIYDPMEMTTQCFPDDSCEGSCLRPRLAQPGTYEISFTGYETCEGDCECDGGGICDEVYEQPDLSDPVTFTAEFEVPGTTSVELVVDH